jgi:alginate O-acetyltransferase complex protein AlgI
MALGLGLMLGFDLPRTYDAPYRAESLVAFWRRWHITLSQWWRDYVYIPLGGDRRSDARVLLNLAAVMLLAGLWCGVGGHFLAWGVVHAVLLVVNRGLRLHGYDFHLPRVVRVAVTFLLVVAAWVLFRAADLSAALRYYQAMLGLLRQESGATLLPSLLYQRSSLAAMLAGAGVVWLSPQTWDFTRNLTWPKMTWAFLLLGLSVLMMLLQSPRPFIFWIF